MVGKHQYCASNAYQKLGINIFLSTLEIQSTWKFFFEGLRKPKLLGSFFRYNVSRPKNPSQQSSRFGRCVPKSPPHSSNVRLGMLSLRLGGTSTMNSQCLTQRRGERGGNSLVRLRSGIIT